MLGTDLVDKGTHQGCVNFARQGTPHLHKERRGAGCMVCVVGCHCSVSPPCTLLRSHMAGGRGLRVFFPQPHPHCVLPSQMLVFFPIISPLILGPEMISHGVRFKEKLIKRSFSPMTVVQLRSSTLVHWERK